MGMLDIGGMLDSLPPGALENAMKDMTPEKMKSAISNMPPNIKDMMAGFGITQEKLDTVLKKIPKDMDFSEVMDKMRNKLENGDIDIAKLTEKMQDMKKDPNMNVNMKDQVMEMLPSIKDEVVQKLKNDFGFDFSDATSKEEVLEQLRNFAVQHLKDQGIEIDPEDREGSIQVLKKEMKKIMGVDPEMSDEEFKKFLGHDVFTMLKDDGFDVDPEQPDESMEKMKEYAKEKAKEFGFDISDGINFSTLKDQALEKLRTIGVPIDEPEKLIPYIQEKIQTFMPLIQNFMSMMQEQQMQQMQQQMQAVPVQAMPMPQQMPMTLNLEINVDEGDHPTTVGYPSGQDGVDEEDVMEMMQDLLYYRTLSKQLIARNQMLERKLESLQSERPVMSRSPMLASLLQRD
ncbi:hypothetical protein FSP39_010911 [Pinctada imbricata]|uniref:Uncharacterized protein n=1 Tax=Pinctada imbricata TaxID=66713 RepID=A0AA88XFD1_PINIB|nr:hypothetical protein FSP39_010911 [Pinctada imbricata]